MLRVKVTAEPGAGEQGSQGSTVTNFVWKCHIEIVTLEARSVMLVIW